MEICSLFPFLVSQTAGFSGFTDCSFSHSEFYRLQLFSILCFTDSVFSHSGFHTFRRFPFQVLQIRLFSFRVFTDSDSSYSGFYRFSFNNKDSNFNLSCVGVIPVIFLSLGAALRLTFMANGELQISFESKAKSSYCMLCNFSAQLALISNS
jgi:hypothetical protein